MPALCDSVFTYEVTLRSTGVHFLFAHAERAPAARKIIQIQRFVFLTELRHEVIVIIDNRPELLRDFASFLPSLCLLPVGGIVVLLRLAQVAVGSD